MAWHACMHTHTHIHMHTHMHARTHAYTHMHSWTHACMQALPMNTQTRTHTHTHTHTQSTQALHKKTYLCLSNYTEPYFDFHCLGKDQLPMNGSNYYTICGTPFPNHLEYKLIIVASCLFGLAFYYQWFFRSAKPSKLKRAWRWLTWSFIPLKTWGQWYSNTKWCCFTKVKTKSVGWSHNWNITCSKKYNIYSWMLESLYLIKSVLKNALIKLNA